MYMQDCVDDLLNTANVVKQIKILRTLRHYNEKYNVRYIVQSYGQFKKILSAIRNAEDCRRTLIPDDFYSWINADCIIKFSVLDYDYNEYGINEADSNCQYIKMVYKHHEMIMHKSYDTKIKSFLNELPADYHCSSNFINETEAYQDFDGYENTLSICKELKRIYPKKQLKTVSEVMGSIQLPNIQRFRKYIPAAGEMRIILDMMPYLAYIASKIGYSIFYPYNIDRISWWTSSEKWLGPGYTYTVWVEYTNKMVSSHMNTRCTLMPLYKFNN